MKKFILLSGIAILTTLSVQSQSIKTIKDPQGNTVFVHKDSSFLLNVNSKLMFYTIDKANQKRNILVTDGDSSSWLLSEGFDLSADYTPFIPRKEGEFVFRAGNIWYISDQTGANTTVFYDNEESSNTLTYLRIFKTESLSYIIRNLIIEARDKTSGDTILLYHTSSNNTTIPFGKKIRIKLAGLSGFGSLSGSLFIGSVYDEIEQQWGEYAVYREYIRNLTLLLPLGNRNQFNVNFALVGPNRFLVDHLDNNTKKAYAYNTALDTFTDYTSIYFPGYTLLELRNVKWTMYGLPLEPPLSYYHYYWKGRDQSNVVRYFFSGSIEDEEVTDLRNAPNVDFLYSDYSSDTIYYYNYGNTQRGLNRTHIYNHGFIKDATAIPFTSDFKLKGYRNNLYFGRYNPGSGQIEAMYKNVPLKEYAYIESTNGGRISNPIDFEFIEDKIFVISRTTEGNTLVVFDPDGIVAVPEISNNKLNMKIFPNPSFGELNIHLGEDILALPDLEIALYDLLGAPKFHKKITSASTILGLHNLLSEFTYIVITSKGKVIYTHPIMMINK